MRLAKQYRPREPTTTALFQLLSEHLPAFLAEADAADRCVPAFVREELEGFLSCGILEHGFAIVACRQCREDRLVPFSCGGRGFCPSCMGRRMADTSARLVDYVLPEVPIRRRGRNGPSPTYTE